MSGLDTVGWLVLIYGGCFALLLTLDRLAVWSWRAIRRWRR